MILDPATVEDLALAFHPDAYLRAVPLRHRETPLGMGFGSSRFSSPGRSFKLLYLAQDVATAIAETIVGDRFEGVAKRVLDRSELEDWAVTEVSATKPLLVLDLRKTGLLRLGVSTDAARAKSHREGQSMSEALHAGFAVDGLLYASRLTGADCFAVYERGVQVKLSAGPSVELVRHSEFVPALMSLGVTVRD